MYTICVPDRRDPGWEPGGNLRNKEVGDGEDSPRPESNSRVLPQFKGNLFRAGGRGRKQFCPALHLSAPYHLGLESFHFFQDVCFIPSGSDSSLGGMHRAEGLLAPLPGLPGWGGERCSPDPASSARRIYTGTLAAAARRKALLKCPRTAQREAEACGREHRVRS